MFNSFLRSILGSEDPPTRVILVRPDSYISRSVRYREDCILLYEPKAQPLKNSTEKYYEIILHKPFIEGGQQIFSLFRTENKEEAENKFIVYKERIPVYVKLTKECSIVGLQKICDILSENSSWSISHLVTHFGLFELFNDPDIQAHIDDVDPSNGMTPLMVAVKSGNLKMVQSLVSLKCSIDAVDNDGNNILHYAAASNKEILMLLIKKIKPSSLNSYNKSGYTPLHMACLGDEPECVKALLIAGADVNLPSRGNATVATTSALPGNVAELLQASTHKFYTKDMKNGGTPLHWALSPAVMEALVDRNCDINAVDFSGRTALHIMVLRGRLECAVALMYHGAELSIKDNDGNTPLHLAVKESNLAIVQALIVFGVDLEAKNNKGLTARHIVRTEMSSSIFDKILYALHAVGAKRCRSEMSGCSAGCAAKEDYNGVPPPPVAKAVSRESVIQMLDVASMLKAAALHNEQKIGRLLCLDGGGIKGLVLVQTLIALEETIGQPIVHCFDWVAGTSTGGILALALSVGKTIRECQRLYFRLKNIAFQDPKPYASEPLEEILKETLGPTTVMADIEHPKLMILAILADRRPVSLHMFRNFQSAQDILDGHNGVQSPNAEAGDYTTIHPLPPPLPPAQQLLWQAARATGAAPSYFRAFERFLDGGLMGNNPTLDALTELAELKLALEATGQHEAAKKTYLKVVVSCGTGSIPVQRLKDIDMFRPGGIFDTAKVAFGFKNITTLLVDQATQSDGRVVDRARAWCNGIGVPYYRFCPQITNDIDMDEKSDEKLVGMLWETQAYMYQNRDRVKDCAALLTC